MSVKNKNRPTNSGLQGKITDLTEEEVAVIRGGGAFQLIDLSEYDMSDGNVTLDDGGALYDLVANCVTNCVPIILKAKTARYQGTPYTATYPFLIMPTVQYYHSRYNLGCRLVPLDGTTVKGTSDVVYIISRIQRGPNYLTEVGII